METSQLNDSTTVLSIDALEQASALFSRQSFNLAHSAGALRVVIRQITAFAEENDKIWRSGEAFLRRSSKQNSAAFFAYLIFLFIFEQKEAFLSDREELILPVLLTPRTFSLCQELKK